MTDVVMDLRDMCRSIRPLLLDRSVTAAAPRLRVELLPGAAQPVGAEVLEVAGYVDGVQSTRLLTVRDERPVYLAATAAGFMDPAVGRVRHARWRVAVLCSHRDQEWADALQERPCELVILADNHPDGLDLAAQRWVDTTRRQTESDVLARCVGEQQEMWTVVDGSLANIDCEGDLGGSPQVVGVVKSCQRQYLSDEHVSVHPLPEGHMSRPFLIPAERRGQLDRVSCYLRQRDRQHQPWSFGLVRVEVPAVHAALLPAAAATVLAGRQRRDGDSRWDRQQAWISRLEDALHNSLPYPLRA